MEHIQSIISKINILITQGDSWSAIEKDLALQYTRDLYEAMMALPSSKQAVGYEANNTTLAESNMATEELTDSNKSEDTTILEEDIVDQNIDVEDSVELTDMLDIDHIEQEEIIELDEAEDELFEAELYNDDLLEFEVTDQISDEIMLEERIAEENTDIVEEQEEEEEEEEEHAFEDNIEIVLSNPEIPHIIEIPTTAIPQVSEFKLWQKDIRTYIGINDKYNFISELFHSNAEAYEEVLNEINKSENKEAALNFLEQAGITTLYQWDIEGFSAQVFYNVLNQFFATK